MNAIPDEVPLDTTLEGAGSSLFEFFFPVSFRIVFAVNLGVWLWLANIVVCHYHDIQVLKVLNLSIPNYSGKSLYKDGITVSLRISIVSFITFIIYHLFPGYYYETSDAESVGWLDYLPLFAILVILSNLLLINQTKNPAKIRLYSTFKRILIGNIDTTLRNNDILLADTLTSYSRILNDFGIYVYFLIFHDRKLNLNIEFLILCYPTFIRIRQCLKEYRLSKFRNNSHLLNTFKYCSGLFPLIFNLVLKKINQANEGTILDTKSARITKFWILACIINSSYTFIWDVVMDWNLRLFNVLLTRSSSKTTRDFLRSQLFFEKLHYYYVAIVIDFFLRFIWVLKLLPNNSLGQFLYFTEEGYFVLEILEILRRWVWVFIKVETEYIKINDLKIDDPIQLAELPH